MICTKRLSVEYFVEKNSQFSLNSRRCPYPNIVRAKLNGSAMLTVVRPSIPRSSWNFKITNAWMCFCRQKSPMNSRPFCKHWVRGRKRESMSALFSVFPCREIDKYSRKIRFVLTCFVLDRSMVVPQNGPTVVWFRMQHIRSSSSGSSLSRCCVTEREGPELDYI